MSQTFTEWDQIKWARLQSKKREKKILCLIQFKKNIHTGVSRLENAEKEQNKLFRELSHINEGEKPNEKMLFLKYKRFLLDARRTPEATPEPSLNATVFHRSKPIKAQTEKPKHKISTLKVHEDFMDKTVDDEKKYINNEKRMDYFGHFIHHY